METSAVMGMLLHDSFYEETIYQLGNDDQNEAHDYVVFMYMYTEYTIDTCTLI